MRFPLALLLALAVPCLPWSGMAAQAPSGQSSTAAPPRLVGTWRVTTSVVAPWITRDSAAYDRSAYRGRLVRIDARAFRGLGPLNCTDAVYETISTPLEGLFQGNLPAPAAAAARRLGFAEGRVPGVSVRCAAGVFELHMVDDRHAMIALDNVIWTLDRSPGALAAATSPEGVVHAMLERHFARPMLAFDTSAVRVLRGFFTSGLTARAERYLAQPTSPDEAPVIDGDPFTDSQEYPTRFSVQRATVRATRATVPVVLADGYATKRMRYLLRSGPAGWRVDDITYADGGTLTELLQVGGPPR